MDETIGGDFLVVDVGNVLGIVYTNVLDQIVQFEYLFSE